MKLRQYNTTGYPITFLMVSSIDHISAVTGITPTVTISKNGGAFASPSGAISEIGNGWYALAGNATDRNTLGDFILHATGTGCDPADDRYTVIPWDPFNATNLGLTNVDTTISSRSSQTAADVADKVLGRNIAGGSDGGRTVKEALRVLRNKVDLASVPGKMLVMAEDDTTESWRADLTTSSSAQAITVIDPV